MKKTIEKINEIVDFWTNLSKGYNNIENEIRFK